MVGSPKRRLALDANFLLDLAEDRDFAHDFKERIPISRLRFDRAAYSRCGIGRAGHFRTRAAKNLAVPRRVFERAASSRGGFGRAGLFRTRAAKNIRQSSFREPCGLAVRAIFTTFDRSGSCGAVQQSLESRCN